MPANYSAQFKVFLKRVDADQYLQERLYQTKELSEVQEIATELGFDISLPELLKAQANRVLESSDEELDLIAACKKSRTLLQWGRKGSGFLDRSGFWLTHLICSSSAFNPASGALLKFFKVLKSDEALQENIKSKRTFNDLIKKTAALGYKLTLYELIRYQVRAILQVDDTLASKIASGDLAV